MSTVSALPYSQERRRAGAATLSHAARYPQQVEVVTTREGFDALAERWAGLEAHAQGAVLFQSSSWARAVLDFQASSDMRSFEPVIATLFDGKRLVGVLPLERIRTRARTILAPLGHAFSQYSDVLLAPGVDPKEAVAKLLRAAIKAAPCDGVSFLKVRDGSDLARGMPQNHLITGTEQGAPYVALDRFSDFAAYFATIKPKTRKNMRNDRNRLERDGPVTHHVASSAGQRRGVIERTLQGRLERLREQGLTSRAFGNTAFAAFCKSLADRPDLDVMAMSLRHNDEPIAEQWGFVHNRRYYAFVASRNFSASDESPGKLHLGEVIHACAERGLRGADLMVPIMPYKLTWATDVVAVRDYALPVTPRGQLLLALWDQRARPWMKNAVLAMPKGMRSLLMKAVGRSL